MENLFSNLMECTCISSQHGRMKQEGQFSWKKQEAKILERVRFFRTLNMRFRVRKKLLNVNCFRSIVLKINVEKQLKFNVKTRFFVFF